MLKWFSLIIKMFGISKVLQNNSLSGVVYDRLDIEEMEGLLNSKRKGNMGSRQLIRWATELVIINIS